MYDKASISFVVLHYNTYQETINCVNSILHNVHPENVNVVIVDNCSPNGSGDIIRDTFIDEKRVYFIPLNQNTGFAVGNNAGINFARTELKSDFVCCINNDTLVEQNDFFSRIIDIYLETNAAVIGPKVYLKDNSYQLFNTKLETVSFYRKKLSDYKKSVFLLNLKYIFSKLGINISKNKNNLSNKKSKVDSKDSSFFETEHTNVVLHGCCLIFTPVFFEHFSGFSPDTFLYREEEILYIDISSVGLNNIYSPKIYIKHLEDAATNSLFDNNYKKLIFVTKNKIKSTRVLIQHMNSMNQTDS